MTSSAIARSTRTIDRRVVHRAQVHEVFLTDVEEAAGSFLAQLPSSHAYFCDSASMRYGLVDILTLMEACRQAATAAAHLFWNVAEDRQFILTRWRASFPVASRPRYGIEAVDLRMQVSLEKPQFIGAMLTGGTTRVSVYTATDGEAFVGTLELNVRYVGREAYQFLRAGARGGSPMPTSTMRAPEDVAADPSQVGCTREDNVAIGPPTVTASGGHATLRLPFHNRSMFDHAQDHAPAMVMVEAARQLVHATCPSAPGAGSLLAEVDGDFSTYVELDTSTHLVAAVREPQSLSLPLTTDVQISQDSQPAASIILTFDTPTANTSRKEDRP